jgi:7-dehydrocholesterol reductase
MVVAKQGLFPTLYFMVSPYLLGSPIAWKMLGAFALFQLILMRIVPGKPFYGPVTPAGNTPVYRANGMACFLITLAVYLGGAYTLRLFSPTLIYDHFGELLGALNLFSLIFCAFLYFKGICYPSSTDAGRNFNPLFDYYWGTELYPRLFGWDVKQFTNCRFGMMSWGLIILSYAAKQTELYGLSNAMAISVGLQLIYIAKFFIWETGYLRSLDIMHDRAGFYICWGCLVWVPCVYTLPSMYLVHYPIQLTTAAALTISIAGVLCIATNYLADLQRQQVRATGGACTVWGRPPVIIPATYQTVTGEQKESILLASGWWGLSRHFHYLPELGAAFCWSVPALFSHLMPYFYVVFLACLLFNRAGRHDKRCAEKYGTAWTEYCAKVPYKIIPGIF